MLRLLSWIAAGILLCSSACNGNEGTAAKFRLVDADGASFYAITTDPAVISKCREELQRPMDERSLHIRGPILRGDDGHNTGWNWRFERNRWDVAEISIELCDGTCALVEADLDYWIGTVGEFCPWSARLTKQDGILD